MGEKRDKLEIVASILENARGGIKKTRLMYLSLLVYRSFEKYLNLLAEKGLLSINKDKLITTERGEQFLIKFKELELIWGVDDEESN